MCRLSAEPRVTSRARSVLSLIVGAGFATSALAILAEQANAQGALPPITIEGKAPAKAKQKATKAAPAPKAAPAVAPAEIVEPAPPTAAQVEQAQQDVPYKTPAAISTATRSDIERFGQISTDDVLRAMPGTYTRESPQNPGLAVNIRGFEGSGRVNMMIDGVRQNFRFTGHEAQGFTYVDPALIAGIDVARGAISTAGGAGALAGYANARTLDIEDVIKPGKSMGALSTLTYGTNGVGWQEMTAGAITNGKVGMIGAISHREPNNYENGDGVEVPSYQNLLSGLFKINFALSSEQNLKLGAQFYDNSFFANSYDQEVDRDTYTLNYTYKPHSNPLIDFALNAYANKVRMEYFRDATPANGPGNAAGRVISDSGKGFDVSNTSRFRLGTVKVTSTYGYEHFFDDVNTFNRLTPPSAGGVNPSGEATIGGTFSQTTFSYGIFDLIAGLRYDTYKIEGTYVALPGDPLSLPPGAHALDRSDEHVSPKITLAAQVLPWLQPYVSFGESFRAPTISETLLDGTHPGNSPFEPTFSPNPFLEPEIQRGWEFGANIRKDGLFVPHDVFRFKAVYFDMDVENYITGCAASGPPPQQLYFCNAEGTSQVRGVELQGMYDTGSAFLGVSYTYADIDLPPQMGGLGAPTYLPEHILVTTAGLRFFDQKLTVGGRVTYTSESNVGEINVSSSPFSFYHSEVMPSYTLVDLFTTYKVTDSFEIGASVTNLFDVDYTPALSTPFSGPNNVCFGGNRPGCQDTGRGRTFLFTAKTHF